MIIVKTNDISKQIVGVYHNQSDAYIELIEFVSQPDMSEEEAHQAYQECYREHEVFMGLDFTDEELDEIYKVLRNKDYSQNIISEVSEKIANFANSNFDFYDKEEDSWYPLSGFNKEEQTQKEYRKDRFYIYDDSMNPQLVTLPEFIEDCILY